MLNEPIHVHFQKISILHPQKGMELLGSGDSVRLKKLKKSTCMKLDWNFQNSLLSKGMNIFLNYTMWPGLDFDPVPSVG